VRVAAAVVLVVDVVRVVGGLLGVVFLDGEIMLESAFEIPVTRGEKLLSLCWSQSCVSQEEDPNTPGEMGHQQYS